jgi:HAD superfamily hydrolase (TIGR01548 family)
VNNEPIDPTIDFALIFDIDGVLADVSNSYRVVVKKTVEYFTDVGLSFDEIQKTKEEGGYNNEWVLTWELAKRRGSNASFAEVKSRFQQYYLGDNFDGLIQNDLLLLPKEIIAVLATQYMLGIFTGRPREEANYFLQKNGILDYFKVLICKEDVKIEKPNPEGLQIVSNALNILPSKAYYFGDAIDDMKCALGAGMTPIGVLPPYVNKSRLKQKLLENGARNVLENICDVRGMVL